MTLIEVMAVVMIIGLTSSLVLLTVPSRKSAAQEAAESISQAVISLQEQAIVLGRPLGIDISENGALTLHTFERGVWAVDRAYPAPPRGDVSVRRADIAIGLLDDDDDETESLREATETVRSVDPPDFISDPTGMSMTAIYLIEDASQTFEVEVAENGEVHVRER
ncbi:MAG: type II secretion system protein [Pseudomonadota bacterium]